MLQTWQGLLSRTTVIGERESWSELEIVAIERERNIILPVVYKEFLQVFGAGSFEDKITIYSPTAFQLAWTRDWIENMEERLSPSKPSFSVIKPDTLRILNSLLKSTLLFSADGGAFYGFFALETYSDLDQSCDIYWVSLDVIYNNEIYRISRNFFEFVQDFCLGTKFSEVILDYSFQPARPIFAPFSHGSFPPDFLSF